MKMISTRDPMEIVFAQIVLIAKLKRWGITVPAGKPFPLWGGLCVDLPPSASLLRQTYEQALQQLTESAMDAAKI